MNTISIDKQLDFLVSVPSFEAKRFKQLIKLMGWTTIAASEQRMKRLYDPETDEYVNEKTMQTIEKARQGKDIAFRGSIQDFKNWAEAL